MVQERRTDAAPLRFPGHHDPVQVPRAFGTGGRTPARVSDQLGSGEGPDEPVVLVAGQVLVQELDRGADLFLSEKAGLLVQSFTSLALPATDGVERAARGPPSFPGPRG